MSEGNVRGIEMKKVHALIRRESVFGLLLTICYGIKAEGPA